MIKGDVIVLEETTYAGHERVEVVHHGLVDHPVVRIARLTFTRPSMAGDLADIIRAVNEGVEVWEIDSADGEECEEGDAEHVDAFFTLMGCSHIRPKGRG